MFIDEDDDIVKQQFDIDKLSINEMEKLILEYNLKIEELKKKIINKKIEIEEARKIFK